jgi:hypothetical protein
VFHDLDLIVVRILAVMQSKLLHLQPVILLVRNSICVVIVLVCVAQGHAMTLLLNEAYQTLMDDSLRSAYNADHSYKSAITGRYKTFTGSPYSTWVGPNRPQGIFVDENVCIGRDKPFEEPSFIIAIRISWESSVCIRLYRVPNFRIDYSCFNRRNLCRSI